MCWEKLCQPKRWVLAVLREELGKIVSLLDFFMPGLHEKENFDRQFRCLLLWCHRDIDSVVDCVWLVNIREPIIVRVPSFVHFIFCRYFLNWGDLSFLLEEVMRDPGDSCEMKEFFFGGRGCSRLFKRVSPTSREKSTSSRFMFNTGLNMKYWKTMKTIILMMKPS